jgi:hypothetical protein
MHDPLRERSLPGQRRTRSRRLTGSMLHRTSWPGGERIDVQPSAGPVLQAVAGPFHQQTNLPKIGHNHGPLLEPEDPNEGWRRYCWRQSHKAAWKTPPREIALRRLERAELLGMSYHDYTLEILERGRYLWFQRLPGAGVALLRAEKVQTSRKSSCAK